MGMKCYYKSSTIKKNADSKAASVLDSTSQSESLQRKADMANNAAQRAEAPRPNNTGMPDNLKAGIESLSGFSMDDVRVHYNSSKPATVQALAYTQGTDIHVAPGQEKCLPHEAWHVAQQMAGRVSPTTNINGMPVNDNAALEHEADVMGEKAVQCKTEKKDNSLMRKNEYSSLPPVQMVREEEFKQNPEKFMRENIVLCDYAFGLQKRMKWDFARASLFCSYMDEGIFDKHFFVLTLVDDDKKIYVLTPALEKYDLTKIKNVDIRENFSSCAGEIASDSYIEASYVPYKHGPSADADANVGHVDLKREPNRAGDTTWNPDFVFTGGMDGCALAATMKNNGNENSFTLWHYQSPYTSGNAPDSSKFRKTKVITDWFDDDEYLTGESEPVVEDVFPLPVATNFLCRSKVEGWKIVSQENHVLRNKFSREIMGVNTFPSFSRPLKLGNSLNRFLLEKKIILKEIENIKGGLLKEFQRIFNGGAKASFEFRLFMLSLSCIKSVERLIDVDSENQLNFDKLKKFLDGVIEHGKSICGDDESFIAKFLSPLKVCVLRFCLFFQPNL